MKKAVTAQQVADRAGVSPTTVSFVMNNVEKANISEATKEHVLKVARELGYVPHALAKSLAKGRSDNIGLFLVQPHSEIFADPYIPNIIQGIREATQLKGFRILVEQIQSEEETHKIVQMLKGGEIAGAIINHNIWNESQQKELQTYPIVSLVPSSDTTRYCVTIDEERGVEALANHVLSLNRTPIGVITYAPIAIDKINHRLNVFLKTLAGAKYTLPQHLIYGGNYSPQSGYDAMQDLYVAYPDIQVVYCMNDMMAVGALSYLNQHSVRVPEEIAIVAYDNIRVSAYLNPPLTTVHAPEVALGESAGALLLRLINGEMPEQTQYLLPTELMIRQSCGAT